MEQDRKGKYVRERNYKQRKIMCVCGCGEVFNWLDKYKRPRYFIRGHNSKTKEFKENMSRRQIGGIPWNKGLTTETDERVRKYGKNSGKTRKKLFKEGKIKSWNEGLTMETDERVRKNILKTLANEGRGEKISLSKTGHKVSKYTRTKISKKLMGRYVREKNPAWIDGRSFEPYGQEFNKKLKLKINKKYDFTCQLCGERIPKYVSRRKHITVHHIDYNKKNNAEDNLISLCNFCNISVNTDREEWTKHFQDKVIM